MQNQNIKQDNNKQAEQSFQIENLDNKGDLLSKYDVIGPLGRGGGSFVYEVKLKKTQTKYALKVIDKECPKFKTIGHERLKNEIQIQSSLDHPNITKLIQHFEDDRNYYLVMEFADQGALLSQGKKCFEEEKIKSYTYQLALAVQYLHDQDIIHRDLKLANVLLNQNQIKLADYGLSVKLTNLQPERDTICGTINYIAPEVVNKLPYGKEVDCWSFGCLVYTMAMGKPPFEDQNAKQTILRLQAGHLIFPDSMSENMKDLLKNTIRQNGDERFTIKQILQHPFYDSVRNNSKTENYDAVNITLQDVQETQKPQKIDPLNKSNSCKSNQSTQSSKTQIQNTDDHQQYIISQLQNDRTNKIKNKMQQQQQIIQKQPKLLSVQPSLTNFNQLPNFNIDNHTPSQKYNIYNQQFSNSSNNFYSSASPAQNKIPQEEDNQNYNNYEQNNNQKQNNQQRLVHSVSTNYLKTPSQPIIYNKKINNKYNSNLTSQIDLQEENNNQNNNQTERPFYQSQVQPQQQQQQLQRQSQNKFSSFQQQIFNNEQFLQQQKQNHAIIQQNQQKQKDNSINNHTFNRDRAISQNIQSSNNYTTSTVNTQISTMATQSNNFSNSKATHRSTSSMFTGFNQQQQIQDQQMDNYICMNTKQDFEKVKRKQQQFPKTDIIQQQQQGQSITTQNTPIHYQFQDRKSINIHSNILDDKFKTGLNKNLHKQQNNNQIPQLDLNTGHHHNLQILQHQNSQNSNYNQQQNEILMTLGLQEDDNSNNNYIKQNQQQQNKLITKSRNNSQAFQNLNQNQNQIDDLLFNSYHNQNQPQFSQDLQLIKSKSQMDQQNHHASYNNFQDSNNNDSQKVKMSLQNFKRQVSEKMQRQTSPLNTSGLKKTKLKTQNGYIGIQENMYLNLEVKNKQLNFLISPDGQQIQIRKQDQKKMYSLEILPEKYLKLYEYGKKVTQALKQKTPIQKIKNDQGVFILMADKKSYEAQLSNGLIIYKQINDSKIKIQTQKDKKLQKLQQQNQKNDINYDEQIFNQDQKQNKQDLNVVYIDLNKQDIQKESKNIQKSVELALQFQQVILDQYQRQYSKENIQNNQQNQTFNQSQIQQQLQNNNNSSLNQEQSNNYYNQQKQQQLFAY